MSKREAIIRLTLILRKLKSKPSSFDDIIDFLTREGEILSYDFFISKRTFQRDLLDIATIFNIEIAYDSGLRKYYIVEEDEGSNRLLEAFDTFSALNTQERIENILYFENRRPLGLEHMHGLIHAAKNNLSITFNYQKYWEEGESHRSVNPYALKEFNHRWYLVGLNEPDSKLKIFGLDRISKLQISNRKFSDPNFNVKSYFQHCFGIIRPDGDKDEPQKVVLSFNAFKGKYIKSLPLHHSQNILIDNEEELKVELELFLTHDFKMEVLSHGHEVKVLEPIAFGKEVEEALQKTLNHYH